MDVDLAIRSRRTVKAYAGTAVPREAITALVEAAICAPNHRLTQPWRFAAIDRSGIPALVALVSSPPVSGAVEPRKLPRITAMLSACAAVVQVTCLRSVDAAVHREDLAATAAAVQNLLLAACGQGLATYWSTNPLMTHADTRRWFGSDPEAEDHVATVWIGVPAEAPPAPRRRPLAEILRWIEPA